ncbi:interleukin-8 [Leucoraja erinacea]|uniref:interleukin-8 n=1 Tax=Leucoraja erinaceus TaxID=7782 RepID=UPI0024582254|nr:interleukin-8 [Leucoraja erinacea]
MKIQATFLLIAAVVICLAAHGLCLANPKITRCRCVKVSSHFIHPRKFQHIDIFPQNSYCRKVEIIITLKDDAKICVNPQAAWVKKVINILTERK